MTAGITQFDELTLWGRPKPGRVTPAVQLVIALAAVLAVGMVGAAVYSVRTLGAPAWSTKSPLQPHPAPVAMLGAILVVFAPPSQLSRFVRLAIALPLLHVLALAVVWVMFQLGGLHVAQGRAPVLRIAGLLGAPLVALALGGATLAAAWLIARRRRNRTGEVAHAAVVLALANLLLLGLWLPIAAMLLSRGIHPPDAAAYVRESPGRGLALVALPPLVIACAYTALTLRERRRIVHAIAWIGGAALLVAAATVRARSSASAQLLYESFAITVLSALAVAIAAVFALGATTWLACRRDRRALAAPGIRGKVAVVEGDAEDSIVACVEITSWLRGPRSLARPFVATSARDELAVPSARVAADLPLASTLLRTGEALVVLRGGDAVAVAGFEARSDGDGPYRAGPRVLPAPGGFLVGPPTAATTPLQSFCLAVWRPSVAYLLIAATVMLPAIIGLARTARW